MSTKKISKIVVALLFIATILSAVSMVFATEPVIPTGNNGATGNLTNPVQRIIGIVQYICYAAAVILIVVLGVKYMTAAPDSKAEIKKSAVMYVVGALLVFAAGGLLGILKNTSTSITA